MRKLESATAPGSVRTCCSGAPLGPRASAAGGEACAERRRLCARRAGTRRHGARDTRQRFADRDADRVAALAAHAADAFFERKELADAFVVDHVGLLLG